MKDSRRQVYISLLASAISFAANLGIAFFLTPFIVSHIGEESYGFVGLSHSFVEYVSLFTLALNSMASRYITISLHSGDREGVAKYFSSLLAANLALAVPLTIILTLTVAKLDSIVNIPPDILPDVRILWSLIFADFIISLISSVFACSAAAANRLDLISARNIVMCLIRVGMLYLLYSLAKPAVWYIGLETVTVGIIILVTNYIFFRKLLPQIKLKLKYIEWKRILTLISSGIWNSISELCNILLEELDLLITNIFIDAASMGLVSIAKLIPTRLLAFFALFGNAYAPQFTIDYAKGDYRALREDLMSSIRLISFCSCIPLACFYAYGKSFFSLWMPGQDAGELFLLAVLACLEFPLVIPTTPMWKLFSAANKVRQTAYMAIATAAASVVLTFSLLCAAQTQLQKMCIIVGVSSCLGIVRGGIFLPLYGAHCIHEKWYAFYPALLRYMVCLGLGIGISVLFMKAVTIDSWILLILGCCFTGTIMLAVSFRVLLTAKERQSLKEKVRKHFAG